MNNEEWSDDPDYQNLLIGVAAEFSAVAIVHKPKEYWKMSKKSGINRVWFDSDLGFRSLNLAQSIYKPLRFAAAMVEMMKKKS